jgi:hypothetical protein
MSVLFFFEGASGVATSGVSLFSCSAIVKLGPCHSNSTHRSLSRWSTNRRLSAVAPNLNSNLNRLPHHSSYEATNNINELGSVDVPVTNNQRDLRALIGERP